jgi:Ca2+/Na+ antiporter
MKKKVLTAVSPIFIFLLFLGVRGFIKGIETHNALRITMSSVGILIFVFLYVLLLISRKQRSV